MSHSDRKPDRNKTFIDPTVQGALVKRLVIHWLVFVGVAGLTAFCLQVLSNPFQPLESHFNQLWWTHGPFLIVTVFLLPVFVLDTIKLSHRFTGPIYRLRQTIRKGAEGQPVGKLKFRDFDFWQGLAEDFNTMVDHLRDRNPSEQDQQESPTEEVEA